MLVIVGIFVMVAITNYWMIIVMVVMSIIFVILRKWFLATAKCIKHVEGIGTLQFGFQSNIAHEIYF